MMVVMYLFCSVLFNGIFMMYKSKIVMLRVVRYVDEKKV